MAQVPVRLDGVHVDAQHAAAVPLGAQPLSEPSDVPQGDRLYRVEDVEEHR